MEGEGRGGEEYRGSITGDEKYDNTSARWKEWKINEKIALFHSDVSEQQTDMFILFSYVQCTPRI